MPLRETTCSEQTRFITSVCSRLLFCFYFYFSSTSKTLPQPGHHLPSNTECKSAPSPKRWWSQYVLEAAREQRCDAARLLLTGIHQFNGQVETGSRISWCCGMHPLSQSPQSSHQHFWCLAWNLSSCPWRVGRAGLCGLAVCLSTAFLNTSNQPFSLSGHHLTNVHRRASPEQLSKRRSNLKPGLTP